MANPQGMPQTTDKGNFGWAVLGFFIPLAGLILWLVWKDTRPLDSIQSRNGFIAGIVVQVVLYVIYFIAMGALVAANAGA